MAIEERRAWILGVVAIAAYSVYLAVVLGRAEQTPLADVEYVPALLWTVGGSIVASIALSIGAALVSPREARTKDQRDREIHRFGEYTGQSFLALGAVAALILAMAEVDQFWIANTIYLAFVLSAVLGSMAKIAAYRRGFQPW
ncbi:hypothetical protein ABZ532_10185 [Streptomyces sp. NPDC019396]|uniref:hypothetical protein n=1 Tax=Streptomyces sp. NPDC019396 TaxID=3154687 RepID=UPI0033D24FFD